MIKVGFIGAGDVAGIHKIGIDHLDDVEIISLTKKEQRNARNRAEELGITGISKDYQELLADPRITAVHCLLPNHIHYPVVKAAIESGKHIMAEKPLTVKMEDAAELVCLSEASGLICSMNFRYRYYPVIQQIRQMISRGELGQIRLVHGAFLQDWLSETTDYNWRLDPEIGGNSATFADIGSHWFDIIQYISGQNISRVFARLGTLIPERIGPAKKAISVRLEDSATVLFELEDGAIGTVALSQVATGRKMSHLRFEINGSRGTVYWNRENPDILWRGYRNKPSQPIDISQSHQNGWENGVCNLMASFYGAIKEQQKEGSFNNHYDYPTFHDGFRSMQLLQAVLKSQATSSWVDVEYSQGIKQVL